jgi:hypothetical protein
MTRRICYLYTETNGLHELDENVSKKNLFGFARLVALNYEIGYIESNNYNLIKSVRKIIKPRCMFISDASIKIHGITNETAKSEGTEIEINVNEINNVLEVRVSDQGCGIDDAWKEHLRELDELKTSVQNAVYEQKDPLLIYKFESFELFKAMMTKVNKEIVSFLSKN